MAPPTFNPPSSAASPHHTATTDAIDRHDFGVQKNRKQASTGGGRAWSEEEEVYLLQTRLQKMPYKHIAAHLKKTELACRLHYHQLSHGSNRRKRTNSVSSSESSMPSQSPVIASGSMQPRHTMPSPIMEHMQSSAPTSPKSYASTMFSPSTTQTQLPPAATLLRSQLPRTPTPPPSSTMLRTLANPVPIMPKPTPARRSLSEPSTSTPPLRLVTSSSEYHHHPPGSGPHNKGGFQLASTPAGLSVDQSRLRVAYEAHRAAFWAAVAAEYSGGGSSNAAADPLVLEDVWRRNIIFSAGCLPPTPCVSPNSVSAGGAPTGYRDYSSIRSATAAFAEAAQLLQQQQQHNHQPRRAKTSYTTTTEAEVRNSNSNNAGKASISALLGIDASPRSPKERELVKRLEEKRDAAAAAADAMISEQ